MTTTIEPALLTLQWVLCMIMVYSHGGADGGGSGGHLCLDVDVSSQEDGNNTNSGGRGDESGCCSSQDGGNTVLLVLSPTHA